MLITRKMRAFAKAILAVPDSEEDREYGDGTDRMAKREELALELVTLILEASDRPQVVISLERGLVETKAATAPVDVLVMDYDLDDDAGRPRDPEGRPFAPLWLFPSLDIENANQLFNMARG